MESGFYTGTFPGLDSEDSIPWFLSLIEREWRMRRGMKPDEKVSARLECTEYIGDHYVRLIVESGKDHANIDLWSDLWSAGGYDSHIAYLTCARKYLQCLLFRWKCVSLEELDLMLALRGY